MVVAAADVAVELEEKGIRNGGEGDVIAGKIESSRVEGDEGSSPGTSSDEQTQFQLTPASNQAEAVQLRKT